MTDDFSRPTRRELELEDAIAAGWTPCPELEHGHDWRNRMCVACGRHEDDGPDDLCEVVAYLPGALREHEPFAGTRDECEGWIEHYRTHYPGSQFTFSVNTLIRRYDEQHEK